MVIEERKDVVKVDERVGIEGTTIYGSYIRENFTKYPSQRLKEKNQIKKLLKMYGEKSVIYSKSDNYIIINGNTFNGFSKLDIEKILLKECKK